MESIYELDVDNYREMGTIGLMFIKSNDYINKIIMNISQYIFTSIGFYYKTSISGSCKIKVLLIDIFGIRSSNYIIQSLDDLLDLLILI